MNGYSERALAAELLMTKNQRP